MMKQPFSINGLRLDAYLLPFYIFVLTPFISSLLLMPLFTYFLSFIVYLCYLLPAGVF